MDIKNLLYRENELSRHDLIRLLSLEDPEEIKMLLFRANEKRLEIFGREVHLRGVIEFSNYCARNCIYCSLREENIIIPRYRMTPDEILESAKTIYSKGIRTIVMQSGEDSFFDTDLISYLIYSIKSRFDVAITLCLGQRNFDEYKIWKIAGADRYILNHESANPDLYSLYHKKSKQEDRLSHLKFLKRVGFQVGSGNIVGLPDQTIEDIADDIILCRDLDIDMASFSPFIPAPNTPYQNENEGNLILTLKTLAVVRLFLGRVHVHAPNELDLIDKKGREKGISAGANVVMPNFTPFPYRDNFKRYCRHSRIVEDPLSSHSMIKARIEALGNKIADTKGHSLKSA